MSHIDNWKSCINSIIEQTRNNLQSTTLYDVPRSKLLPNVQSTQDMTPVSREEQIQAQLNGLEKSLQKFEQEIKFEFESRVAFLLNQTKSLKEDTLAEVEAIKLELTEEIKQWNDKVDEISMYTKSIQAARQKWQDIQEEKNRVLENEQLRNRHEVDEMKTNISRIHMECTERLKEQQKNVTTIDLRTDSLSTKIENLREMLEKLRKELWADNQKTREKVLEMDNLRDKLDERIQEYNKQSRNEVRKILDARISEMHDTLARVQAECMSETKKATNSVEKLVETKMEFVPEEVGRRVKEHVQDLRNSFDMKIAELKEKLERKDEDKNDLEQSLMAKVKLMIEDKFKEMQSENKKKDKEIEELKSLVSEMKSVIVNLESQINEMNEYSQHSIEEIKQTKKKEIEKIKKDLALEKQKLLSEFKKIQSENEELKIMLNKKLQEFDNRCTKIDAKCEILKKDIKQCNDDFHREFRKQVEMDSQTSEKITECTNMCNELSTKLDKVQEDLRTEMQNSIKDIEESIQEKIKLKSTPKDETSDEQYKKLQSDFETLSKNIQTISDTIDHRMNEQLEQSINNLKDELRIIQEKTSQDSEQLKLINSITQANTQLETKITDLEKRWEKMLDAIQTLQRKDLSKQNTLMTIAKSIGETKTLVASCEKEIQQIQEKIKKFISKDDAIQLISNSVSKEKTQNDETTKPIDIDSMINTKLDPLMNEIQNFKNERNNNSDTEMLKKQINDIISQQKLEIQGIKERMEILRDQLNIKLFNESIKTQGAIPEKSERLHTPKKDHAPYSAPASPSSRDIDTRLHKHRTTKKPHAHLVEETFEEKLQAKTSSPTGSSTGLTENTEIQKLSSSADYITKETSRKHQTTNDTNDGIDKETSFSSDKEPRLPKSPSITEQTEGLDSKNKLPEMPQDLDSKNKLPNISNILIRERIQEKRGTNIQGDEIPTKEPAHDSQKEKNKLASSNDELDEALQDVENSISTPPIEDTEHSSPKNLTSPVIPQKTLATVKETIRKEVDKQLGEKVPQILHPLMDETTKKTSPSPQEEYLEDEHEDSEGSEEDSLVEDEPADNKNQSPYERLKDEPMKEKSPKQVLKTPPATKSLKSPGGESTISSDFDDLGYELDNLELPELPTQK